MRTFVEIVVVGESEVCVIFLVPQTPRCWALFSFSLEANFHRLRTIRLGVFCRRLILIEEAEFTRPDSADRFVLELRFYDAFSSDDFTGTFQSE